MLAHGEPAEAERLAHSALATSVEHELPAYAYPALDVLAAVASALESFEEAARILGASDRAREDLGRVRWAYEQETIDELEDRLRSRAGCRAAGRGHRARTGAGHR